MVRVVECHAGGLDFNPGRLKDFSFWNCFNDVLSNLVMPGAASENESGIGLYSVVCL